MYYRGRWKHFGRWYLLIRRRNVQYLFFSSKKQNNFGTLYEYYNILPSRFPICIDFKFSWILNKKCMKVKQSISQTEISFISL